MRQKLSRWYAVPPYNLQKESWTILNEDGELVATFERQEDCERAVEVYNRATWWTPAPVDSENEKKQ